MEGKNEGGRGEKKFVNANFDGIFVPIYANSTFSSVLEGFRVKF